MFKAVKDYEELCNEFGVGVHLWLSYYVKNTITYFDGYVVVEDLSKVSNRGKNEVDMCENVINIDNFSIDTLFAIRKYNKEYYKEKKTYVPEQNTMVEKMTEDIAVKKFFEIYGQGLNNTLLAYSNKAKVGRDKIKFLTRDVYSERYIQNKVGYKEAIVYLHSLILSNHRNVKEIGLATS